MRTMPMRATAALAGLALTAGLTATALPSAEAAGCSMTLRSYTTVKVGSRGAATSAAECALARAGYAPSLNGRFSSADAAQAMKFQRSKGLRATGAIGHDTWTALMARGTTPALHRGDRGADVRRLQRALRASGRHVWVTGHYDAATVSAVRSYQLWLRFASNGTTTSRVWSALQHGELGSRPRLVNTAALKRAKAVAFAKKQLGDPYRFGAAGPNAWDCSGLTMGAWKAAGIRLPHSAAAQFHKGRKVSKSRLLPGDLVFFYSGPSHVAIYVGHGKVIHAARPGSPVSYIKMAYMPFAGARRMA